MNTIKRYPFILSIIASLLLFYPILSVFFSQDDFFHFQAAQTDGSLKGFLSLFSFPPFIERNYAFYRPLFREVLYNLYYNTFGLEHLPFRLLSLFMQSFNIYLVYTLINRIFNSKNIALLTSFFFGITAANVATMYYLAGGIQALGVTMFILLSALSTLSYIKTQQKKFLYRAFIFFLGGLGSHELGVITPFVIGGLIIINNLEKKTRRLSLKILIPFFVVLAIYLFVEVKVIGFSKGEVQYQPVISISTIINTFTWYTVWALGLPEMLIDFVRPGLSLNPSLMRYWGAYFKIIFPSFLIALVGLAFAGLRLIKRMNSLKNKNFWFFLIWFPLGIAPVVILPLHKSTYYLAPSLIPFWASVSYILWHGLAVEKRTFLRASFYLVFLAITTISVVSIKLGDITYLSAQRGRYAKLLLDDISKEYPTIHPDNVFFITNDPSYPFISEDWGGTSKQAAFALSRDDALQLYYHDWNLQVFYEDLNPPPEDISQERILSIVARDPREARD